MYFLGSAIGPGVLRKRRLLRYEIIRVSSLCNRRLFFFLTDLDPDGCLVADQLKVYAIHLKNRVQINKRGISALVGDPAKNYTIFAMDWCFLLTGTF